MLCKAHGYWLVAHILKRLNLAKMNGVIGWCKPCLPTACSYYGCANKIILHTLRSLTIDELTHIAGVDFKFPCCRACDDLKSWEVLSEDCLSAESASSAAPNFLNQRREAEGRGRGCIFVWLLYFGQAK
jgi:hypothetical protein